MENGLTIFENEAFRTVRTMTMPNGEVGFVGADVAKVLGYSNASKAVMVHVHDGHKAKVMVCAEGGARNGNLLRKSKTTLISEAGVYELIMQSKLPEAKAFQHWVTHEVLPQIRRTGGYVPVTQEDDEASIMAKALSIAERTLQLLQQEQQQLAGIDDQVAEEV